jgi:inner membrane transporter RhtA
VRSDDPTRVTTWPDSHRRLRNVVANISGHAGAVQVVRQQARRVNRASTPRFSPTWLVLVGILSVQFGAVVSKGQFGEIPPVGMVFLRLITSSLILLAVARPRLRGRPATDWRPVLALGFALGAMNWAFYESFARIPLGAAVAIEFAGPLLLAAVGSRRPRDLVWVGLAALGITLFGAGLFGVGPNKVDAIGFALALFAGGCWALYVVSTAATGRRWAGVEGLAVASTIATLAIAPFAVVAAGERLLEPRLLVLGALVGLLSSMVPYSLEMVALRTLPPRVFGILMSLEPAAAALAAAVLLSEFLTPLQLVAMACVTAASVGATRRESAPEALARD